MAEPESWGKKVTVRIDEKLLKRLDEVVKQRRWGWGSPGRSETIRDCIAAGLDVIDEGKFKVKRRGRPPKL